LHFLICLQAAALSAKVMLKDVDKDAAAFFVDSANELIEEMGATNALAAALARMTGKECLCEVNSIFWLTFRLERVS
jgi:hypothetical protein